MKKVNFLVTLFLIVTLFMACETDSSIKSNEIVSEKCDNFVNIEEADAIASLITFSGIKESENSMGVRSQSFNRKEIGDITQVPDASGSAAYYIINYEGNNGFLLLSADNRINPVLAFSDSESFPLDLPLYPDALVKWLEDTKDLVQNVRLEGLPQTVEVSKAWELPSIQHTVNPIDIPLEIDTTETCQSEYITYGPLTTTIWGQWAGYNDLVPMTGCSNSSNGRAPTGCVATAMGQVMKYHQYPNTYTWSAMADKYSTTETARLMRDIGVAVNMNYTCTGSSADTKVEVASAFINNFGYSSATYADYNADVVKEEIKNNRPVILRGGRKSGWWIFGTYADGHAWVCDGYLITLIWNDDCTYVYRNTYLHMNWGWYDDFNGWFTCNDFNPGEHTFNYKKGMVYNIVP